MTARISDARDADEEVFASTRPRAARPNSSAGAQPAHVGPGSTQTKAGRLAERQADGGSGTRGRLSLTRTVDHAAPRPQLPSFCACIANAMPSRATHGTRSRC
jgi:hypothetical protein